MDDDFLGGINMQKSDYRQIAKETLTAIKKGFYYGPNGERCKLPNLDFTKVEVFSPEQLQSIEDDDDEFFESAFYGSGGAEFYLVDADSYEVAKGMGRVLVMNFANAHTPGGGFLNGARAQEESLCRCSTLYASISSDKAKEMYDYNNSRKDPLDSNYMLLSENVAVFRDFTCKPLPEDEIYTVSVVTVPAPNKNGRASGVSQRELDRCMRDRIEKMLWMAARRGYRTLILGAWGCGAFGHDTKTVAQYFYDAFFEGVKFTEFFDTVCFAILHDDKKIQAFQEVFGDKLVASDALENESADASFWGIQASHDFPICNHIQCLDSNNIGYCQGILVDGMPFEAELYNSENGQEFAIVMPLLDDLVAKKYDDSCVPSPDTNVTGLAMSEQFTDNSILDTGMVDEGEVKDEKTIHRYINYLVENGLIKFTTRMYNGAAWYRTDVLGNDLIKIVITLSERGQVAATTNLTFRSFSNALANRKGKVIEFPKE